MREITADDFRVYTEDKIKTPLFDDEDGDFWGFGHIDKQEFVDALVEVWRLHGVYEDMIDWHKSVDAKDVDHRYIRTTNPEEMDEDMWTFSLCKKEDQGAFAVTLWRN